MDEVQERMMNEVFTRLRETEAKTREQCVKLDSLCEKLDNFSDVTEKFFEMEESRNEADERKFNELIEHEKRMGERMEKREANFWKVITILIGALVALAIGPKVAKEIIMTATGAPSVVSCDICPPSTDRHWTDLICFREENV